MSSRDKKKKMILTLPEGMDFADLRLSRDSSTGDIEFDWEPIEKLCEHNKLNIAVFRDQHEDNMAGLITAWYAAHLEHGGKRSPVADELITEAALEEEYGGGISHPPGKA